MMTPEMLVKRTIEDKGFEVHDANVIFRVNCPNIDLIVYGRDGAIYVQVKSSVRPAIKDHVTIDGTPWTAGQLEGSAPIFNKKDGFKAKFIVLVNFATTGPPEFYVAPPNKLEALVRPRARAHAARPKKDGATRSINFRKQLPRKDLRPWLDAWRLLGEPKSAVS